ncbi:nitric oxide synthase oxygenase [Streptomyces olivaceus]|uniref:nitric oxide synthase oxygenase n=1 Tax=Streptomyces olivaceus TaxID=47716 RepID=UPI001CCF9385|nr:nitric oxide synthase oxygenase [Streptomyces olivaceus]MBZ6260608.1 nitric oxide synthase oxygenase [Streptomyces olivaceus]
MMGPESYEHPRHEPRETGLNPKEAREFLEDFYSETGSSESGRIQYVMNEISRTGTYRHTLPELTWGARAAWRNSARCIGRLYWNSLHVRDRRHVFSTADVADECAEHLRTAWKSGKIRPTITIFAPDGPQGNSVRIVNDQLIRYAGHRNTDGSVTGDGRNVELTDLAKKMGWSTRYPSQFDILPLIIEDDNGNVHLYALPDDAVKEVPLTHPEKNGFDRLGLRWHAIPAISNMILEIGGIKYSAAPFNGWYMQTEIGARNLVDEDRYNVLPRVAEVLGIDTADERSLWRDRALVEINRAVLHSFDRTGTSITDHHTESRRFLQHVAKESRAGRSCPVDWSWIVPPLSASLTGVYHRYYDEPDAGRRPAFLARIK